MVAWLRGGGFGTRGSTPYVDNFGAWLLGVGGVAEGASVLSSVGGVYERNIGGAEDTSGMGMWIDGRRPDGGVFRNRGSLSGSLPDCG